jgi:hypothetical protein
MAANIETTGFASYLRELRALTEQGMREGALGLASVDLAHGHLDGRVARELRSAVSLEHLREIGAFFTGEDLANRLVGQLDEVSTGLRYADPSCGCGDLLLAVARRLPIEGDLDATLRAWGSALTGVDREPSFVGATRQRLALLAMLRGARRCLGHDQDADLCAAFPNLDQGDGLEWPGLENADVVLLNPPYGLTAVPEPCAWGSGLATEAATWIDAALARMAVGSELLAILPDVLRSGSRYARWRVSVRARAAVLAVQPVGRFDALTDVDVFLLRLRRRNAPDQALGGATLLPDGETPRGPADGLVALGDICRISVGSVVDRRDPHTGGFVPYVTTRELPQRGEFRPERTRRFSKRLFKPPFVVVRRTSRPTLDEARLRPVVVRSNCDIAVENHLLVLEPAGRRSLSSCRGLAEILVESRVSDWLNDRIRLRHLTVEALRELPVKKPL